MNFGGVRFVLRVSLLLLVSTVPLVAAENAHLSIDASKSGAKIDRNLFGQFAENLGHGLYEGIWVGPDSPIPNTRGIRKDVVTRAASAEGAQCPLAGRLLCRPVPLAQRSRPGGAAAGNAELHMGRRGRHEQLRHRRVHGFHSADRQPALCLGQCRLAGLRRRRPNGWST